jgi:hypothetical protein
MHQLLDYPRNNLAQCTCGKKFSGTNVEIHTALQEHRRTYTREDF